ncbi:MAG: DUF4037 domain-containing protein [Clostridia bacterium]|nr:DUF4037 domain-containing protein [Clostridia bacterium]
MKGIEISKKYYEQEAKPILERDFADILSHIAIALCGSGSECLGFDDEISRDHDFEPGFCIFIPGEDIIDRKAAFSLERFYAKLPKEFMGLKRSMMSPVGGNRHGVIRLSDFLNEKIGTPDGNLSIEAWLKIPEYSLLEVTNGEVFFDKDGTFTKIREHLSNMPADVVKKRLAGNLLIMAQAGQYNYTRCIKHGEKAAAQMAVFEFVNAAINVCFLLNGKYRPFYKWCFRSLKELKVLNEFSDTFEYLITTENDDATAETKYEIIEDVAMRIISELQERNLTDAICGDLEKHAYSVNDKIEDSSIRNLHIMYCV